MNDVPIMPRVETRKRCILKGEGLSVVREKCMDDPWAGPTTAQLSPWGSKSTVAAAGQNWKQAPTCSSAAQGTPSQQPVPLRLQFHLGPKEGLETGKSRVPMQPRYN